MSEQKVDDLITAWFSGEYTMFDACTDEPEIAWEAILGISRRELTDEQRGLLAAGALETLLAWHGATFIERVEHEAHRNPKFSRLLGGVWRQEMPEEIWKRIEKARKEVW
jgi:hypothetical protein